MDKRPFPFQTDASLKRLYYRYNKKYFGGRLPLLVTVSFQESFNGIDCTNPEAPIARCSLEDKNIEIGTILRPLPKVTKMTLLHEMAHFSTDLAGAKAKDRNEGMHGEKWQMEMMRLSGLGAFRELW